MANQKRLSISMPPDNQGIMDSVGAKTSNPNSPEPKKIDFVNGITIRLEVVKNETLGGGGLLTSELTQPVQNIQVDVYVKEQDRPSWSLLGQIKVADKTLALNQMGTILGQIPFNSPTLRGI